MSKITENNYVTQDANGDFYCLFDDKKVQKIEQSKLPQKSVSTAGKSKINGTILMNCDKTKFLIFVRNEIFDIYDCTSTKEVKISDFKSQNSQLFSRIEKVKWSHYSPDVFACLTQREIEICQLSKLSPKNQDDKSMKVTVSDIISSNQNDFNAFAWGNACNVWLKYSIVYSQSKSNSIYLVRPATPKEFALPFKDYMKMVSTLDAKSSLQFTSLYNIKTKGSTRIMHTNAAKRYTTEIPLNHLIGQVDAIQCVNSYLNPYLILIDDKSCIYIISINEVEKFISDFSNSNSLSFMAVNAIKFKECNVLYTIDELKTKPINFTYSNGFFFNTGNKLYRLFLKRRIIKHDNVNDINNNDEDIDENSLFDVVDLKKYDEFAKFQLLAEFDNILGVCGNQMVLNDKTFVRIGEFPDSIKKIDFHKLTEEQTEEYMKEFDQNNVKERFKIQNNETQKIRMMNEVIRSEANRYIEKESEIKQVDDELMRTAERAEELQNKMRDIMEKLQKKKKK